MADNPVTLGALVTAYVTAGTAIFGYLSNRNAQRLEQAKFESQSSLEERKFETGLILEIAKSAGADQDLLVRRLCVLAATGLVPNLEERLRTAAKRPCPDTAAPKP